jgi:hypothetical protein
MCRSTVIFAVLAAFAAPSPGLAQATVPDSIEFARWRQANVEDLNGLHEKFVSLARAMPAAKLAWRPMDGFALSTTCSPTLPPKGISKA